MVRRDDAQAQKCRRHWHTEKLGDLAHLAGHLRAHDAASHEQQWPLSLLDCLDHSIDFRFAARVFTRIAAQLDRFRIFIVEFRIEYVLGHINDDWPRTARAGNEERFLEDARQFLYILDEIIMLCNGRRDAKDVRLLERILADIGISHLSGDADERNRVCTSRSNARDEIRRPWPRGRKDNADLARSAGIAVSCMDCALLMAREHMREFHLVDSIIQGQHCTARIAEDDVHPFSFQALQHSLSSIHQHTKAPSSILFTKRIFVLLYYTLFVYNITTRKYIFNKYAPKAFSSDGHWPAPAHAPLLPQPA